MYVMHVFTTADMCERIAVLYSENKVEDQRSNLIYVVSSKVP